MTLATCVLGPLALVLVAHSGEHQGVFRSLPPFHPILVNFTLGLIPASFIADALGRLLDRESLCHAGWWMLLFAVVVTPFTVIAGWVWLRQMGGASHPGTDTHRWLGTVLAAILPALMLWRGHTHLRGDTPSVPYLVAAGIAVAVLMYQGYLGGRMSFGSTTDAHSKQLVQPRHQHGHAPVEGSSTRHL